MSINKIDARIWIKSSTISGQTPSLGITNNPYDGTYTATDISQREFFANMPNKRLWFSFTDEIKEVAWKNDLSGLTGTNTYVTGATLTNSGTTLVLQRNDGINITVTGFTATDTTKLLITDFNTYSATTNTRINSKLTQGGNSFGTTLRAGTQDNQAVNLITNNIIRLVIDNAGNITQQGTSSLFSVNDFRVLDQDNTNYRLTLDSTVNTQLRLGAGWTSVLYNPQIHTFGTANNTAINLFGSSSLNALRARGTTLDVGTGFTNIFIPAIINLSATTTGNTASRLVESDIDGAIQAIEDIIPLQIFSYNVQQNLSNYNNWSGTTGFYSGNTTASTATTITGTYQGQFYDDNKWYYWMKESNNPIRLPKESSVERGLYFSVISTSTTGSGTTILSTYDIPSFTFKNDGDEIEAVYNGYYGNTTYKQFRLYFNNSLIFKNDDSPNGSNYSSNSGLSYNITSKIIRTDNSGGTYCSTTITQGLQGTFTAIVQNTRLSGVSFNNNINIRLEGSDPINNNVNGQINELTKIKYKPFV